MRTIELTQGKVALVDDELIDQLNAVKWFAERDNKTFYAVRRLGNGHVKMHNVIFELQGIEIPPGFTVDHADGDGLNNQRDNLRLATRLQQQWNKRKSARNSSGYIGVNRCRDKWAARLSVCGKRKFLGYFADPFSAAWVRDQFARQAYGDFAVLNGLQDRRQRPR